MKKIIKTMSIIIFAFSMLFISKPMIAATNAEITNTNDPHALTITRNVKDVTNPVTNTFGYTITADTNNPGTVTGYPTTASIAFNAVEPNSTSHIATQTTPLDFSGATFSELGDYKFVVREVSSTDSTTYPASTDYYTVLVSVRNELDANNKPTGNLVATLVSQALVNDTTEKADIVFPADSKFSKMSVSKSVTGDLADTEEYFKFKVNINGTTGDKYVISGQDATVTYGGASVSTSTTYTVGQDNYIYLKDGQTATIGYIENGELCQIPIGTTYSIVEQGATDYKTYVDGSTTNSKSSASKTIKQSALENGTSIVNNKETEPLTGVLFSIAPYAIIVVLALALIVIFRKISKK